MSLFLCAEGVEEAHVNARKVNHGVDGFAAVFAVEADRTFKVEVL
jgi:hypothetical protein